MHKAFETQRRAHRGERVTFEIPAGSSQVYEAAADAPGAALMDAARMSDGGIAAITALGDFLDAVLLPESRERFDAALRSVDPNTQITLEDAAAVVGWLVSEVYAGRPTTPPPNSPVEPAVDGPTSTPAAPSPDLTP
jgi:hypothetical protein